MSDGREGRSAVPPRWLFRLGWALHRVAFVLSGGRLGLRSTGAGRLGTLRLRTLGRRSGQERTTMLSYLEDGPNLAVVASNAGAAEPPAWWLNLQASPEAEVDVPDGRHPVVGRAADIEEQARLWRRFSSLGPYESYAAMTERQIPIVILEPLPDERA